MPIALDRSGYDRKIGCSPISIAGYRKELRSSAAAEEEEAEGRSTCTSTTSTSSIGKNSEGLGSDDEDLAGEGEEVESKYKGSLSALESLEEALPIRRGVSNFYNGKSKSFASLSDAMLSCSSMKDLVKQENAYTRKRRNLLASKNFHLKSSSSNLLKSNGGGISKKPPSNARSLQALAMAMNNNSSIEEDHKQQYRLLPPLHPPGKTSAAGNSLIRSTSPEYCSFPMRSFSLTDLQAMANSELNDAQKRFC